MELDVTITISVKLVGPKDSQTEIALYLPHLEKSINVCVPNSISKSSNLRLKGLGRVSSDGKKGDLFLKFDYIDDSEVYIIALKCRICGSELSKGAQYCLKCGAPTFEDNKNSKRQQEWAGKIVKCPSCGEDIPSFTAICPSCGHEFRGASSSYLIKEFTERLEDAFSDSERISLIRTFPISNTKEDILEFMILAATNIENSFQEEISEAWSVKFEQAYEKSKVLYGSQPEFDRCYNLFVQKKKSNIKKLKQKARKKKSEKRSEQKREDSIQRRNISAQNKKHSSFSLEKNKEGILICGCLLIALICLGSMSIPHKVKEWQLNGIVKQVEECISSNDFEAARIKANQIIDDSGWSTDSKQKWTDIRESLLDTINRKEAELTGKIPINFSSDVLMNMPYTEVEKKLQNQGFNNIKLQPIKDLITGWIVEDGQVEEVTVDGKTDYEENTYYSDDVEIIIYYHTFKSKK